MYHIFCLFLETNILKIWMHYINLLRVNFIEHVKQNLPIGNIN